MRQAGAEGGGRGRIRRFWVRPQALFLVIKMIVDLRAGFTHMLLDSLNFAASRADAIADLRAGVRFAQYCEPMEKSGKSLAMRC